MPPHQLHKSILLALGLAACDDKGVDSGDTTYTGPCLSPTEDTDDSGDTGDTGETGYTGPCLDYAPETGDSGDTADSGDSGDTGGTRCLDAPLTADEPEAPEIAEKLRRDGFRGTVAARAEALGAVLEKGVLPDDVAALLARKPASSTRE